MEAHRHRGEPTVFRLHHMSLSNSCHCSTLCLTGHCVQYRDGIVISTAAVNFTLRRPEVLLTALGAVVPSRWAIEMSRHVQGASQETQTFMIIKDGIAMAAALYTFAGSGLGSTSLAPGRLCSAKATAG